MERPHHVLAACLALGAVSGLSAAEPKAGESPVDHLPPHISRVTWFGERADWSHDGKRILFLSKTHGDAFEIEVETGALRLLTGGHPHAGYTRALYLSNGHVLLSGAPKFDPASPDWSRAHAELLVLDPASGKPPVPLGTERSEGPAVSRRRLHIAWTIGHGRNPSSCFLSRTLIKERFPTSGNDKTSTNKLTKPSS